MSDILNEISKFVAPNPTPNEMLKRTEAIFKQLDAMESFIRMNVHTKESKTVLLRYNQAMRESAVLSIEAFQSYMEIIDREI